MTICMTIQIDNSYGTCKMIICTTIWIYGQSVSSIWNANSYNLYKLSICMTHTDGSYRLTIYMDDTNCQFIWFIRRMIRIANLYGWYRLLICMIRMNCQSVWPIQIDNSYHPYRLSICIIHTDCQSV